MAVEVRDRSLYVTLIGLPAPRGPVCLGIYSAEVVALVLSADTVHVAGTSAHLLRALPVDAHGVRVVICSTDTWGELRTETVYRTGPSFVESMQQVPLLGINRQALNSLTNLPLSELLPHTQVFERLTEVHEAWNQAHD